MNTADFGPSRTKCDSDHIIMEDNFVNNAELMRILGHAAESENGGRKRRENDEKEKRKTREKQEKKKTKRRARKRLCIIVHG